MRAVFLRAAGLLAVIVLGSGCASGTAGQGPVRPATDGPTTVRVPRDAPTIQAAVDAAREGDLVLVSPGVYRETVQIKRANLVLRGAERNAVIIDGEVRRANGIVVTAPGVAVENLTVRNHTLNGVLVTGMSDTAGGVARGSTGYRRLDTSVFPPLKGFRISYVTAGNNALYGIYAFDAQHGIIENNYASGSADSGIYVGQCKPCHIVVRDNVAERNAVGYEGANASTGMYVLRNRFVANRVGLTSNSDYQEALVPQENAVIMGNLIGNNAEPASPAQADGGFGLGIGIAGGSRNLVSRNRIVGNPAAGLVLASSEDLPPNGNRIEGNVLSANGIDLVYAASARAPGAGNCLRDNRIGVTLPARLDTVLACPQPETARPGVPAPRLPAPRGISFRAVVQPPHLPDLPSAATAPGVPASAELPPVDLDRISVPETAFLADCSGVRL
ncbi:right-handed parallel beta-helix repeat-containing protein [Crossiella sp. CA198]|uniref:right-handed parallel beta-helix repeat-containing protein n=1 Tax=Crossiella sp. CA198 TaxID=3455607 RepID=UPI003F8D6049